MIPDGIREQLQNIIRGKLQEGSTDSCTTIWNLLCKSFGTSPTVKGEFESKAIKENLWLKSLPPGSQYLTEGGESKVFLSEGGQSVIKMNDAGYYATWTEYFNSLLLHNLLFDNTAYSLLGLTEADEKLFAVIQQQFVEGDQASLDHIEGFLNFNGFQKTRRQDYYNNEFRLALEDMHDENVLAKGDILFFIDTVFYIM
jgi:hypothetical protein